MHKNIKIVLDDFEKKLSENLKYHSGCVKRGLFGHKKLFQKAAIEFEVFLDIRDRLKETTH